ncbi:NACHT domain- and WD repeat-containing protein 1, partial [Rhizophlyctis rosea]
MMQLMTILARSKGTNQEVAQLVASVQGGSKVDVPFADLEMHLQQALSLLAGRPVYLTLRSPLYIRLCWEKAKDWHSWEVAPEIDPIKREQGKTVGVGQWMKGVLRKRSQISMKMKELKPSRKLKASVQECIDSMFDELEKKVGKVAVSAALSLITIATRGLSATELEDVMSLDNEVVSAVHGQSLPPVCRIPNSVWIRIRSILGTFLDEFVMDGQKVYMWSHVHFEEAVKRRYLKYDGDYSRWHSLLADYFESYWSGNLKKFTKLSVDGTTNSQWADRLVKAQSFSIDEQPNHRRLSCLTHHQLQAAKYAASSIREKRSMVDINEALGTVTPVTATTPTTPTSTRFSLPLLGQMFKQTSRRPEAYLEDVENGFADWATIRGLCEAGYFWDSVKYLEVAITLRKEKGVEAALEDGEELDRSVYLPELHTFLMRYAGHIMSKPSGLVELAAMQDVTQLVAERARKWLQARTLDGEDEKWIEWVNRSPVNDRPACAAALWQMGGMPRLTAMEIGEGRVIAVGVLRALNRSTEGDSVVMGWGLGEGGVRAIGQARLPKGDGLDWQSPKLRMSRDGKFLAVFSKKTVAILSAVDLTLRCILHVDVDSTLNDAHLATVEWAENPHHGTSSVRRLVGVVQGKGAGKVLEWKFEPELPFLDSNRAKSKRKGAVADGFRPRVVRNFDGVVVGVCSETLAVRTEAHGGWTIEFTPVQAREGPIAKLHSGAAYPTYRDPPLFALARDTRRCLAITDDDPERYWLVNVWDGKRLCPIHLPASDISALHLSPNGKQAAVHCHSTHEVRFYTLEKNQEANEDDSGPSVRYRWIHSHTVDVEDMSNSVAQPADAWVGFDRRKKMAVTKTVGDMVMLWDMEGVSADVTTVISAGKVAKRMSWQVPAPILAKGSFTGSFSFAPLIGEKGIMWAATVPEGSHPLLIDQTRLIELEDESLSLDEGFGGKVVIALDSDGSSGNLLTVTDQGNIKWMHVAEDGTIGDIVQSDLLKVRDVADCKILGSQEDEVIFATGHGDGKLLIWEWDVHGSGAPMLQRELLGGSEGGIVGPIVASANRDILATAVSDFGLFVFDRETDAQFVIPAPQRRERIPEALITSLAVDRMPDGTIVLTAGYSSGIVKVYACGNGDTHAREFDLKKYSTASKSYHGVVAVCIDHAEEGSTVVFATDGISMTMLDLSTGASAMRYLHPYGTPFAGAISCRPGKTLAEAYLNLVTVNTMGQVRMLAIHGADEFLYEDMLSEPQEVS